ncbi:MAG: 6-phosphofructokinase [Microthrixaceae bacterium]
MLSTGGTILGSINKPIDAVAADIEQGYLELGLDALIAIGGDGSLAILQEHARSGWNLVGIPKTIDNDVALTDRSIGFDTAVRTVTRACAQLRTTGVSHDRVMIPETDRTQAGHLALFGIASGQLRSCRGSTGSSRAWSPPSRPPADAATAFALVVAAKAPVRPSETPSPPT